MQYRVKQQFHIYSDDKWKVGLITVNLNFCSYLIFVSKARLKLQIIFFFIWNMLDFEVIKQLGSGSFGRVLKVRKIQDSSIYAMKIIKMAKLSPKEKQLTLNQIRLLASVDSPYIIQYKGAFFQEQENTLSILMQYADGGDLEGLIKKKIKNKERLTESFILKTAFEILKGLKFLHSNHIIHRDIKTANIFFSNNIAKLGDLNLSKLMKEDFAVTNAGTPYYTSPEIWLGHRYTELCDIWSLGCVIYQLCTFRAPFEARNMHQLMKKVTSGFYDPIPSFYSKKLSYLIRKCLIVDQKRRPSAEQLLKSMNFGDVTDLQEGQANMIDTIQSPLLLKNINQKLPKTYSAQKNRFKAKSYHQNCQFQTENKYLDKYRANSINSVEQRKYIKVKQILNNYEPTSKRENLYGNVSPGIKKLRY